MDSGMVYTFYDLSAADSFQSPIIGSKTFNEKKYYAWKQLKGNGLKEYFIKYCREDEKGAFYQFDTIQNVEIMLVPSENIEGYQCSIYQHSGKADYKIFDYHAEFITSECVYKNVIKVGSKKSKYPTYIDFSYYKRGFGWVGSSYVSQPKVYLQSIYIDR
jgi:hypothetical protein